MLSDFFEVYSLKISYSIKTISGNEPILKISIKDTKYGNVMSALTYMLTY